MNYTTWHTFYTSSVREQRDPGEFVSASQKMSVHSISPDYLETASYDQEMNTEGQ